MRKFALNVLRNARPNIHPPQSGTIRLFQPLALIHRQPNAPARLNNPLHCLFDAFILFVLESCEFPPGAALGCGDQEIEDK